MCDMLYCFGLNVSYIIKCINYVGIFLNIYILGICKNKVKEENISHYWKVLYINAILEFRKISVTLCKHLSIS